MIPFRRRVEDTNDQTRHHVLWMASPSVPKIGEKQPTCWSFSELTVNVIDASNVAEETSTVDAERTLSLSHSTFERNKSRSHVMQWFPKLWARPFRDWDKKSATSSFVPLDLTFGFDIRSKDPNTSAEIWSTVHERRNYVKTSNFQSHPGTYPVLCAYSIFCRKIRFFAFLGDIFLIFGQ